MISTTAYTFTPVDFDPFEEGKEIEKITLTNDSQREIWLSCIFGGDDANLAYNESSSVELSGQLDLDAFKKSVQQVIRRHEALRSTISADGETLIIYKDLPFALELQDISHLNTAEQQCSIQEFLSKEIGAILPLQEGPLFKVFLHKLAADKHLFTFIKHHIIGDGWSTGIILEDVSKFYNAYSKGLEPALARAAQMSDYVVAQDKFKSTSEYKQTEDYWLKLYKNNVPVVDLPTDHPRRSPRTYKGNRIDYPLSNDLVDQLKKTGAKAGSSLVTTLLSAFELFLYQKTNQKELVVGLPAAGQSASGLSDVVGHCVNLLPLKSTINLNQSFFDYLRKRKSEVLDAYDHQRLTFGELIKKLHVSRDPSRITLVPVIFNIDMGMDQSVSFDGLQHTLISNPRAYENFEIYLNATGSKKGIVLEWSYNTGLFNKETIEQFHASYVAILEKIVSNPTFLISDLKQKKSTADKSNFFAVDRTLNELLQEAVKNHSKQTAVSFGNASLTYQELNEKANQLAHLLISKNIQTGDRIALSIDRSIEMIIALVAIIKTGSAYVPIDASYPQDRINFIVENAGAKLLLVSKKNADRYVTVSDKVVSIEDAIKESATFPSKNIDVKTDKNTLVYILHTSGSTGQPKGVCMGQNALVNLLLWQKEKSTAGAGTKTLQFSPLSFDVSFQDIFATLTTGGTLVLITEDLRLDPFKLLELINKQNVNRIFLPFVALQAITESAVASQIFPKGLKEVMTAGEQLKITPQIVAFFAKLPGSVLYNQYGPTEAHVVTELKLSGDPRQWPNLPTIGKAIYNTQLFIVDEDLYEVQEGEIGELCISGLCLAEGYLNLPEMTQEKFTYLPEDPTTRIYRTGDLARFLPDGNIEFLGRKDHQVKIRGYRVELGEIEAHLNKQEGIKQAVVQAQEDKNGNKKLVAYLTSDTLDPAAKGETVSWHERWNSIYDAGVHTDKKKQDNDDERLDLLIGNQASNSEDFKEQANEWNVESAKRIKEIGAKRIIEIGCGGGQFINDLAPTAEKYFATDYSEVAIAYINDKIKAQPEKWKNVTAVVAEANDFSKINGLSPDLILINSVIQYFPDTQYLYSVIEQAANTISKGCIFLGDVQGRSTLKMHHASGQLARSSDHLSVADFKKIVDRRIQIEDEFTIDPAFFYFIKNVLPKITHVEVQLRKGKYINETTKYHYDVWLYVNSPVAISEPDEIMDWQNLKDLSVLQDKLVNAHSRTLIVTNIPNQRVRNDFNLVQILADMNDPATVADLKNKLAQRANDTASDPGAFWELGERARFQTHVRWTNDGTDGMFEVVFIPKDAINKGCVKPTALPAVKNSLEDFEASEDIVVSPVNADLASLWKSNLKKMLPDYMIPGEFVMINKLPLTATGKIDRKALPAVADTSSSTSASSFIAPRTSTEQLVAGIWSDVLNIKNISIDSDFFELGGHSLIAVKVMVAIEKETGRRLPLATLFENSTIEKLARMLTADEVEVKWDSLVPIKPTGSKKPIYLIHGGGLNVLVFQPLGKYMDKEQPVYGMQALGLNGNKRELLYTMEELAERYNAEILQNDPEGPYAIAGYSFGGLLAYEMTKQLMAMGKRVELLGILDTYAGNRDSQESKLQKVKKKFFRQFRKIAFFSKAFVDSPKEMVSYQKVVAKRKFKGLFSPPKQGTYYDEVFSYEKSEILESYDTAWRNYVMKPIDIKVDVFRTKKRPYFLDDLVYLGWREYAQKGVNVHEVPGDHKTFLFPPNDKEFAEILQRVLDSNKELK